MICDKRLRLLLAAAILALLASLDPRWYTPAPARLKPSDLGWSASGSMSEYRPDALKIRGADDALIHDHNKE